MNSLDVIPICLKSKSGVFYLTFKLFVFTSADHQRVKNLLRTAIQCAISAICELCSSLLPFSHSKSAHNGTMKILCVAEKPSIARSVSQILSGGRFETSGTANKYIKNFKFKSRLSDWGECDVVFTSVAGHLTTFDFSEAWRKWKQSDPAALFEQAQIVEEIPAVSFHINTSVGANSRVQRVSMTILSVRAGLLEDYLFGRTVTEKENILARKSRGQQRRAMQLFK